MGEWEIIWLSFIVNYFSCDTWFEIEQKKIGQIENEAIDCEVVEDEEGFVINFDFKILIF